MRRRVNGTYVVLRLFDILYLPCNHPHCPLSIRDGQPLLSAQSKSVCRLVIGRCSNIPPEFANDLQLEGLMLGGSQNWPKLQDIGPAPLSHGSHTNCGPRTPGVWPVMFSGPRVYSSSLRLICGTVQLMHDLSPMI